MPALRIRFCLHCSVCPILIGHQWRVTKSKSTNHILRSDTIRIFKDKESDPKVIPFPDPISLIRSATKRAQGLCLFTQSIATAPWTTMESQRQQAAAVLHANFRVGPTHKRPSLKYCPLTPYHSAVVVYLSVTTATYSTLVTRTDSWP